MSDKVLGSSYLNNAMASSHCTAYVSMQNGREVMFAANSIKDTDGILHRPPYRGAGVPPSPVPSS